MRNILIDMLLHKKYGAVNTVYLCSRRSHKMFLIINEQRDKMRKTHIGKQQIVDAISQLQRFIDPGEKRDHFVTAAHRMRLEMLLNNRQRIVVGQQTPAKMEPVYSPWII